MAWVRRMGMVRMRRRRRRYCARGQRLAIRSKQLRSGRHASRDGRDGDEGCGAGRGDRLEDALLVHSGAVLALSTRGVLVATAANLENKQKSASGRQSKQTKELVTNLSFSTVSAGNGRALSGGLARTLNAGLAIVLAIAGRRARIVMGITIVMALREASVVVVCCVLVVVGMGRRRTAVVVVGASRLGRRIGRARICLRLERREVSGRRLLASRRRRIAIDGVGRGIPRITHVATAGRRRGTVAAGARVVDGRQGDGGSHGGSVVGFC